MPTPNQVFISYRRSDTSGHARFIYRYLSARLKPGTVFFDRSSIDSGDVFPRRLRSAIAQARVVLVLIGPDWLTVKDAQGRRRLENEDDVVRHEIVRALTLRKRVIPVLFDETPMPTAADLPAPLDRLAAIDAVTLRGKTDEYELQLRNLTQFIADRVGGVGPEAARRFGPWTLSSPPWAFFRALRSDSAVPGSVYAGLDGQGHGLFHSDDGGRSWEADHSLGSTPVNSIALSSSGDVILVGSDDGLFESRDRGKSWLAKPEYSGKAVLSVAISPFDAAFLMVGCQKSGGTTTTATTGVVSGPVGIVPGTGGAGLKVSNDGGSSWVSYLSPQTVNGIWLDDVDSRLLVVASIDEGLFQSRDGATLSRVDTFPAGHGPACVTVLPHCPRRLLVGTARDGVWFSDDNGVRWGRAEGIPRTQVSDLRQLPGAVDRVAAATPMGYYESQDGGRHWESVRDGLLYPYCMALSPLDDGSVIVGLSGGGAYRKSPGSSTWNPASQGFPATAALQVFWEQHELLQMTPIGVFESRDRGDSWRLLGPEPAKLLSLAVGPPREERTSPSGSGLHSSRAGGAWRVFSSPSARRHLYVGTASDSLFRSRDRGTSWERLQVPARGTVMPVAIGHEQLGLVIEHSGFYRSTDDGETWSPAPDPTLGNLVAMVTRSRGSEQWLFASTIDRGLFWSRDGGDTWTKSAGVPADEGMLAVSEPDEDSKVVFAATIKGSVFRSVDRGMEFTQLGTVPLPAVKDESAPHWISLVAIPATDRLPTTLVVGAKGAYLSHDLARTWSRLPIGRYRNAYHVNDLAISDDATALAVATPAGLFIRALPAGLTSVRTRSRKAVGSQPAALTRPAARRVRRRQGRR